MLDISFIRENADLLKSAAKKKHIDIDIDRLLTVDEERRTILAEVEEMRAKQNEVTEAIGSGASDKEERIAEMKSLKGELQEKEGVLKKTLTEWQSLMIQVPNIPDMSVPEGVSDEENQEVKQWGKKPSFSFTPKDHVSLLEGAQMADITRGTKVSGFRGYFLTGDGARLNLALWRFAYEFFEARGLIPMIAPSLVRKEAFLGTGYLPQGEDDLYKTQDDSYLAGTSEVALMGYYMDEVVPTDALPIKFLGFSDCFRREAGSHGKDAKGLFRVHEFYKFEQVILCRADHEESVKWHEWINRNTEEFIETLEIPYRTVVNCGGDLGLGQVKKYDVELWVPSEEKYREISSASYFHDFQTRRLNIRYRGDDGKLRFAHSLNATSIATPRALVSLAENNQQEDGTICVPKALVPYVGKETIGGSS